MQDFKAYQPIHQVEMQTASVKELSKCRLQLHTPYVGFMWDFWYLFLQRTSVTFILGCGYKI